MMSRCDALFTNYSGIRYSGLQPVRITGKDLALRCCERSGGDNDLSNGPVTKRSCTDLWCLIVLLAAWVAYVFVTMLGQGELQSVRVTNRYQLMSPAGLQDGVPSKLYLPRDYSGAYCNLEENWNFGPNLKGPGLSMMT